MKDDSKKSTAIISKEEIAIAAENDFKSQTKFDNAYDRKKGFIAGVKFALKTIKKKSLKS